MSEAVSSRWSVSSTGVLRLVGLVLLAVLLTRLDLNRIGDVIRGANLLLIALSVIGIIPLILIKTIRWQGLLRAQAIRLSLWPALLVYFGSLFIGFLTPGRLGEFVKAVYVSRDCDVPLGQAFSSVLADRLFDLYALLIVGGAALLTLALDGYEVILLAVLALLMVLPLLFFLHDRTFGWMQEIGLRLGAPGRKLFGDGGIVSDLRAGLRQLTWKQCMVAAALTAAAYGVFFGQCYVLALALDLSAGFGPIMFAVALGSLITLVPISISGLGTREAAMIAYLDSAGVSAEAAMGFSLLVFVTFYVAGGIIGAAAWWIKPVPVKSIQQENGRGETI